MKSPIERHLVDFLKANPGPEFLEYRRRFLDSCLAQYGPDVVARVKAMYAKEYKAAKPAK